ncbi:MAG TPA: hypothetical protein VH575_31685 [Gemmataceae bacterium]|jgi:hypothetical protein
MKRALLIALCLAMLCLSALPILVYVKHNEPDGAPAPKGNISAPMQKTLKENPYYLRADKKLQVSLNVEADHPKLSQVIAKLREATGLDIAIDDSLQNHDPNFGHIQTSKRGYRAWQIMEMVAKKDLQNGCWEKTDQGYRLLGASTRIAAANRPHKGVKLSVVASFLSLVGLLLFALLMVVIESKRSAGSK